MSYKFEKSSAKASVNPHGQNRALTSLTEVGQIYSLHSENCYRPSGRAQNALTIMQFENSSATGIRAIVP